jgi:hypothetical protein
MEIILLDAQEKGAKVEAGGKRIGNEAMRVSCLGVVEPGGEHQAALALNHCGYRRRARGILFWRRRGAARRQLQVRSSCIPIKSGASLGAPADSPWKGVASRFPTPLI